MRSDRTSQQKAGVIRPFLVIGLLLLVSPIWARINITPRPVTIPLTWASQDIVIEQLFCVQSTNGPRPQDTDVIDYAVTAIGPLSITDGVNTIPVQLQWQDVTTPGLPVIDLTDGITTSETLTGLGACTGSNNGRLIITLLNDDITVVTPGIYTGTFTVEVSNSGRGRSTFNTPVTLDLTLPDSVRVSQTDDLDLGIYAGADIPAADALCIFRASGNPYTVTVSGTGPVGPGGGFVLSGNGVIPISVTWDDGNGPVAVTRDVPLADRQNAVFGPNTCDNGAGPTNAELGVLLEAVNVDAVGVAGDYSTTLTILIEMQ